MSSRFRSHVALSLATFAAAASVASAQQSPDIGYAYPAGGRQGLGGAQ